MTSTINNQIELLDVSANELESVAGGGFHLWYKNYGISITGDGITIGLGDGQAHTLWFD